MDYSKRQITFLVIISTFKLKGNVVDGNLLEKLVRKIKNIDFEVMSKKSISCPPLRPNHDTGPSINRKLWYSCFPFAAIDVNFHQPRMAPYATCVDKRIRAEMFIN